MKAEREFQVKIGKTSHRVPAGNIVPAEVENFLSSNQKEDLRKGGIISDDKSDEKHPVESAKKSGKSSKSFIDIEEVKE
jgi:hypothetical protein